MDLSFYIPDMAFLDEKTLLSLPVHTKSGLCVGRLVGFDFDVDQQAILRYRVRPKGLAARVLKTPLLIDRSRVLSIDAEKMIVDDNVEKEMELAKAKAMGLVSNADAKA